MTWHDRAACAGKNPEVWFDLTSGQPTHEAAATCARCPVRPECGEAGRDEEYGVWGGMTPVERRVRGSKLRACEECGAPFRAAVANKRFCTPECGSRSRDRRRREARFWDWPDGYTFGAHQCASDGCRCGREDAA